MYHWVFHTGLKQKNNYFFHELFIEIIEFSQSIFFCNTYNIFILSLFSTIIITIIALHQC